MGRYIGPVHRLSRREGVDLGLKNTRRATNDKSQKRLNQPPGMHGARRNKLSDYGVQLREKQKMKRIYGLLERQFRVFFGKAARKRGVTGETLIQLLERRLDNTVFRLFFATTRREARQMVSHGLIRVNGKPVNIPSYLVRPGDKIEPRPKESNLARIKGYLEAVEDIPVPDWLMLDRKTLQGQVVRLPTKADAGLQVEESLIVELYSK